jgi:hypothetical protein
MKIDFSAAIKDFDGDAVKDGDKEATLGRVACTALLASYADEQNLSAEDKVKRFRLAEIAAKGGAQEVKVDDVALMKKLIGKAFAPLIGGRAYDLIEPPLAA